MSRYLLWVVCIMMLGILAVFLLLKNQDCFQETKTMVFKTKEEAQRTGLCQTVGCP